MDNIDISLSNTSINNNVNRPCINIEITGLKGVSSQELIDLTTKLTEFYNTLDSKINTTQSSLQSSINTLHTEVNQDILNESNRAINKENTLSTSLQDVAQMYTSLHSELTISINSEVTRATSKEQELTASINIVSTQLATESSNREDADEELQEQITSNLNNFNNYRLKSEQDVIDSNLDSKFNSYRTSSDQNLIDEELLSKINSIEQQVNKIKNAIIDLYSSIDGGNATSNTTYVPDL